LLLMVRTADAIGESLKSGVKVAVPALALAGCTWCVAWTVGAEFALAPRCKLHSIGC
jgi:hypothetical protein